MLLLLQGEGLITPYRRGGVDMTIWTPDRAKMPRVAKIITAPHTCGDSLMVKVCQTCHNAGDARNHGLWGSSSFVAASQPFLSALRFPVCRMLGINGRGCFIALSNASAIISSN